MLKLLPEDYLQVIPEFAGREGFLGDTYLRLYRLHELLTLNIAYGVPKFLPPIFIFGSNGFGDAFAFVLGTPTVIRIPCIPLVAECAQEIAPDFATFLQTLSDSGESLELDPDGVGKEVHCKVPLCHGGSPTDPDNRVLVPVPDHPEICVAWTEVYIYKKTQLAQINQTQPSDP